MRSRAIISGVEDEHGHRFWIYREGHYGRTCRNGLCTEFSHEREFFEIGARTNFSFLEGASKPEEMVTQAALLDLSGLGIADRNSVAGVVRAHAQIRPREEVRAEEGRASGKAGKAEELWSRSLSAGRAAGLFRWHAGYSRLPAKQEGLGASLPPAERRKSENGAEKGSCILSETDLVEWGDEMMLALIPDPPSWTMLRANEAGGLPRTFEKTLWPRQLHMALSPSYDGR